MCRKGQNLTSFTAHFISPTLLYPLPHTMKTQRFFLFLLLPAALMLLLPACSASKKAKKTTDTAAKTPELSEAFKLEQKIADNELNAQWFSAKAKVEAAMGSQQQSFGADIRLKKDSVMWMSVYATIGIKIEVARALITPDSVKVLDKFNKRYYTKSIGYLKELVGYPLDFVTLQRIILGQKLPAAARQPQITTPQQGELCLTDLQDKLHYAVFVEPAGYTIIRMLVADSINRRHLTVDMGNYQLINNKPFAHNRRVNMRSQEVMNATIEMSKVEINKPLDFPFSVSDRYEVIR